MIIGSKSVKTNSEKLKRKNENLKTSENENSGTQVICFFLDTFELKPMFFFYNIEYFVFQISESYETDCKLKYEL